MNEVSSNGCVATVRKPLVLVLSLARARYAYLLTRFVVVRNHMKLPARNERRIFVDVLHGDTSSSYDAGTATDVRSL